MRDTSKLIEFQNTNFLDEPKDEWIRVRVTKSQKEVVKAMADARDMKMSKLIMELLQYEKNHNVILNQVLENNFRENK